MALVSFRANVVKVRGLQFGQDNRPRFSFRVAENHGRYDQNNQWQETGTTWWNVTVFGKQAEDLADMIQEGAKQQVVVTGRSQTREYETQNGQMGESLDVVADFVGLVHRAKVAAQTSAGASNSWGTPVGNVWTGGNQGEAPF